MLVNEDDGTSQAEIPMLHPSSRILFRFWEKIRAEQSAPRRDQLDLAQIKQIVPDLFIAARDRTSDSFRWRLAGTNVCEIMKQEVTGADVFARWNRFDRDIAARYLGGVDGALQPCLIRFKLHTDLNQVLGAELVGFPILAADGSSIHVFGGIFPFRDPIALGHSGIRHIEMSGARSIWTEHLPGDQLLAQTQEAPQGTPVRNFHIIPGGRRGSH